MSRLRSPLTIVAITAGAVGGAGAGLLLFDPLVAALDLSGAIVLPAIVALVATCSIAGATLMGMMAPQPASLAAAAIAAVEQSPAVETLIVEAAITDDSAPATPPLSPADAVSTTFFAAPTPPPERPSGPQWLPTSAEHDAGFELQIAIEGGRLIPGFPARAALRFAAYAPIAARAVRLRLSVPFEGRVADAWAQTWPINGLPEGERTVVVEITAPVGLTAGSALLAVELEGEPGRAVPRRRGGALPIG